MGRISRRRFLRDTATVGTAVAAGVPARAASAADFRSRWGETPDRVWLGREYWANPLQDWRVASGRIECVRAAPDRNVHLLTRQVGGKPGDLRLSARIGRLGGAGSAGFRIGIQGPLRDYRNSLIAGKGIDAGFTSQGGLFIGTPDASAAKIDLPEIADLVLTAAPEGSGLRIELAAHEPDTGKLLGKTTKENVPADRLEGALALVANFQTKAKEAAGRYWFSDWQVAGSRVEAHDERAFGPILFSQYTLSRGVLKLTAQMPPMGEKDGKTVRLQLRRAGAWIDAAEEAIHPEARTAAFRIEKWNDREDVPYRFAYGADFWEGTIRRDPAEAAALSVADISCNIHLAFPNALYVANVAKLNPDFLAFTGDQFYESTGGYGVQRTPLEASILDYLRKWYLHGWTWRDLTRDRPSISIPDDHDVYQGNIWGEGGAPRQGTQERGGYDMPAAWVNVVHRTQTAHHPDPHDPAPAKQGIGVYYGPMVYGRVSFAILADRQFKSAPEGKVPPTGGRGDHVKDPKFDPRTADLPGLELLGERQMKFLSEWAADWRGADLKAVLSQTIFTGMATTHGGTRERLRADYDANGWPQRARNAAVRELRRCFAFHIAGDQHLPALVHYGVDGHRDAGIAFAGPAVNVGYPRWWEPEAAGRNRAPGAPENTGDFIDAFGHPLTVIAVANGAVEPRKNLMEHLQDRASGIGMVRFDKVRRTITVECWPILADPLKPGTQFPGWPVTVGQRDNYGRKPAAHLPTLEIAGAANPVVRVVREEDGETLYSLRIAGARFQPPVFAAGKYTVRVGDPDADRWKEVTGIEASPENSGTLRIEI